MELKKFDISGATEGPVAEVRRRSGLWRKGAWMGLVAFVVVCLTVFITLVAAGVFKPGEWFKAVGSTMSQVFSREEKGSGGTSDYWAVFVSNNQVYFGRLAEKDGQYLKLKDVYYLRVPRDLQPPVAEDEKKAAEQQRQEVQLIKLGNELHGPADEIWFNRENVLFIERLKKDSRVVKGIEQFKGQL